MLTRRTLLSGAAAATLGARPAWAGSLSVSERARQIYRRSTVINGNLVPGFDDRPPLDPDFAQTIRASGLTAIKASLGGADRDFETTLAEMAAYNRGIDIAADIYLQVRSIEDIATAKRLGKMGIIYSFESVGMLERSVERIAFFAQLGVRVMQLSYNNVSPFASGVMASGDASGLSPLGRQAIAVMNGLGVALDLSHANEASALQSIRESARPVLITHTGCASIHNNPRNKSDAVLRATAKSGGVVGIYELSFLTPGNAQQTLDDFMRHLEHALKVCGEDHVGIGSDGLVMPFDTGRDHMAAWNALNQERKRKGLAAPGEGPPPFVVQMNRPDRGVVVAEALLRRGYSERLVEKVLGANFLRAFGEAWA